jgi:phosphohistidine phosphatase
MKTLFTFRHAKSGWDQPALRDFDRALNAKGRRAATVMGRHLRDAGLTFDAVIASPAVRVTETLDAMFDGLGRRLSPTWDRRLYLASASALLEIVQEAPDSADTLLMAAHNPGIEELVLLLASPTGEEEIRSQVGEKYPTASFAELRFDVDHWADIAEGAGLLVRFVRPRDLDAALGPDAVS